VLSVLVEESRRTISLAALFEVVQVWQARVASASAVDAFLASGRDESGFGNLEEIRGRRRRRRCSPRCSSTAGLPPAGSEHAYGVELASPLRLVSRRQVAFP
jgi:hypothetical protein